METRSRIEQSLERALGRACAQPAPPKLAEAMRYAVFPGGARIRPRLALAVARACGDDVPALTDAAMAAVELMHCASLVHDDMPCFDDAAIRRGRPAVHTVFGAPLALLAGDGLIVLAYDTIAAHAGAEPMRAVRLVSALSAAVGMPGGITAGQAWESEPMVDVGAYHRAKTSALFIGAATMGAIASGDDPARWQALGERLGDAYQAADDLRDAFADEDETGKPKGQDAAHARPNALAALGPVGCLKHIRGLIAGAIAAIPPCAGAGALETLILSEAQRLVPNKLAQQAVA
jgi:geranylgeranyl diphosphate synthase type II